MKNNETKLKEMMLPILVAIADDSAVIRDGLTRMLSRMTDVELAWQAGSVAEAMAASRLMAPDVIILDVEMPDGKGIEVLQYIKSDMPKTVVMILSNYAIAPLQKSYYRAGADYFYDKSTEFEKIFETLSQLISKRTQGE